MLRHPWKGGESCSASAEYARGLAARREREAQTLASLTGWEVNAVRRDMGMSGPSPAPAKWWEKIWRR